MLVYRIDTNFNYVTDVYSSRVPHKLLNLMKAKLRKKIYLKI